MVYVPTANRLGVQPIAQTNAAAATGAQPGQQQNVGQAHALGEIISAFDSTLGGGEFIYLKGVVGTVVGSLVTFDTLAGTTTLCPVTANLGQAVAVAMSANVAGNFGWYQIGGNAVITKTATKVNPSVPLFISGTAGSVFATATAGREILNCRSVNAASVLSAVGTITAYIDRPFAQGQIT